MNIQDYSQKTVIFLIYGKLSLGSVYMAWEKGKGKPVDEIGRLAMLQQLFPEAYVNGKLDIEKLKDLIGEDLVYQRECYNFTWVGKQKAKDQAIEPAKAKLIPKEDESINWTNTGNLFIEGDNLDALKLLQAEYYQKIKIIYIDPPYNTGQQFTYNDDFKSSVTSSKKRSGSEFDDKLIRSGRLHSKWLSMMYPRLMLARKLLTYDGVIFISVDNHELANLILSMNEIFGEENFVSILKWKRKRKPAYLSAHVATLFEYVLVYAKDKTFFKGMTQGTTTDTTRPVLNAGNKPSLRTLPAGADVKCTDATLPHGLYGARSLKFELLDTAHVQDGKLLNDVRIRGPFRVPQKIFERYGYITSRKALRRYVGEEERKPKLISDGLLEVGTNEDAEEELKVLFNGKSIMDYPKPVRLLKFLINTVAAQDDLILDFFAGSCSTAQAVLELNKEDKGRRRFIMVQSPELIEEGSAANEFGCRTIADIGKERIKRVIAKIDKKTHTEDELGFKVFQVK